MTRIRPTSVLVQAHAIALALALGLAPQGARAVALADQPVFATSDVPGNLALALSVEFPTAISVANLGDYADASEYLGYFDPKKCYTYTLDAAAPGNSYFQPAAAATGANRHGCSGQWSGNFMNWATMQTIDPFRWALSGGYRAVDTADATILEKAWGSSQGSVSNFPLRGSDQASGHRLPGTVAVSSVTPFSTWSKFNSSVWARGNTLVFTSTGSSFGDTSRTPVDPPADPSLASKTGNYRVFVRVKVCDASVSAGALLESNCVRYGDHYKPEGLLQQYANKIRYSAFSYLNAGGDTQQGGVMRAPMGFIGPSYPQPLSTTVVTNSKAEWDAATGIMAPNPDTASAAASGVAQSGVMNYLNKFGQAARNYMTYDNVGELYYAVVRYFENLGNVGAWTASVAAGVSGRDARLDGFPAVGDWRGKDPIAYSCQKNFVLGIGDDHTHYDANVAGGTLARGGNAGAKPSFADDTISNAALYTNALLTMEGMGNQANSYFGAGGTNATYYIAGLAYGAHVNDIRPDLSGTQNIATYWMDVMEYQRAEDRNPYWLAAKYGGFGVPAGYDPATTTPLAQSGWNTTGETIDMNGSSRLRPDNYFLAGNAGQMVAGLKAAFTNIANAIQAYTTSFSLSSAQVASAGSASYASQYDAKGWTGVVSASRISFAADGTPSATAAWSSSTTLQAQLAGSGWNTGRNIATWNGSAGVAFRAGNLTAAQQGALTPAYASRNTAADYLNYLRGDTTHEAGSTAAGSTKALRSRRLLLGDIVGAKLTPVGPPAQSYGEARNPGYAAFKAARAGRPTMVYAGANDGMLHAFNGALTGTGAGREQFAYVPGALYQGPNGTPQADGLAQLGNPNYAHHFYVDATPVAYDIDFNNAGGAFASSSAASADWRTLLLGGLGKGGKSYYAIDVTDPAGMSDENAVAARVQWEFSDATMGYSYGTPIVVKTRKYGWVVVLSSGYNNSDGYGYLYFVHPQTGALLESVRTPTASHGLAQISAYVSDFTDNTADAIYAGDLDGQLWRFELGAARGGGAYPAPTLLAMLTDASGAAQPVTTAPLIEVHPLSRKRFVLVGTGKLLDATDVRSPAGQSFYAVIDGTAGAFAPAGAPAARADLLAVADVLAGINLPDAAKGWYFDLGAASGVGWRVVANPAAYNGVATFATLLTSGDACSPAGQSRIYALNYGSGKSALLPARTAYIGLASAVTDLRIIAIDGQPQIIAGATNGELSTPPAELRNGAVLRLLNWRELPMVD